MVADCSYFSLSKAFTMVCAPYFCMDVCGLLIFPLVDGFDGLRAIFSANGCGLLILVLDNGFPDCLRADFLSRW